MEFQGETAQLQMEAVEAGFLEESSPELCLTKHSKQTWGQSALASG